MQVFRAIVVAAGTLLGGVNPMAVPVRVGRHGLDGNKR